MEQLFDPPGIVCQAEDCDSCLREAKALMGRLTTDAISCGRWLMKAKEKCQHGQWAESLRKQGFAVRTAQWLMKQARDDAQMRKGLALLDEIIPRSAEELAAVELTAGLIPELAMKGISPRILPDVQKLSVGQQYHFLNCLNAGMNARDALADAQTVPAGPRNEPGDDPDEEDPFGKAINAASKAWAGKVELVARIHEVPQGKPQELQGLLRKFFKDFKAATQTPLRPVPPPEPGKCRRCHREVLFVTSRLGKRFALDAERTTWGRFDLNGGLAVYVRPDPASDVKLYAAHVRSCPVQPRGK